MSLLVAGMAVVLVRAQGAAFDCSDFGCTCQGFQDYYGGATIATERYTKGWGCAVGAARTWFNQQKCIPACTNGSNIACHPNSHSHPGCGNDCTGFGCTCQGYMDFYGATSKGAGSKHSVGCAPKEAQKWNTVEHCDTECKQNQTGCEPSTQEHPGCAPTPTPPPTPTPAPTPVPPTPPPPPFDCVPFGCTCQGFADWYGASSAKKLGCATSVKDAALPWWTASNCEGKGIPKITPSLAPGTRRGGCKCITDTSAGFHSTVKCPGLWTTFSADYNVPEKCLSTSCGLIVDVHGFTMTGAAENANSGVKAMGEEHGYIVVNPNAPGKNWNANPTGGGCTGLATPNATPGKQSCFVAPWDKETIGDRAINTWVQEALEVKEWNVDRNRVHLMGFSEGGWVTGRMLCNYPHLYASFSMLAGASNADPFECIQPGAYHPPVLVTQGYNDMSSVWRVFNAGWEKLKVKYQLDEGELIDGTTHCGQQWEIFDCNDFGCTCQGFADYYGVKHLSTLGCAEGYKLRKKWHSSHSCSTSAKTDVHPGCEGCFSRTRHLGPSNVPVELLTHNFIGDYMLRGHCFPGAAPGKVAGESYAFGCPGAKEVAAGSKSPFHWGEESMKFFLAHPKKASVEIV